MKCGLAGEDALATLHQVALLRNAAGCAELRSEIDATGLAVGAWSGRLGRFRKSSMI